MMKKLILCGTCAALTSAASAASITWQSVQYVSGPSDVNTQGSLVGTWSPYLQQTSGGPLTVNGVTFLGDDLISLTTPSWFSGQYTGFGSPGTTDSNYNSLLSGAQYGSNGDGTYFSFGGLTVGDTYLVQIWAEDTRSIGNRRWENFYADDAGYPADGSGAVTYPADGSSPNLGQYVIGTFVANATSEQIDEETWSSSSGQQSGQVNLFQLRDVTTSVPEPSTLALLGGGAMVLWRHRRRA